ncbi:30S ribosomal protein S17 [Capsaspora owczarzaki ATCC 30864]|nr:30S ribosomal protein S17 [Capsaspora owczarzaki ATCC 30864]|eukprot:XP_004349881.1 30S ribosomal protein S17 [Capsaspora owczarzaki ATCC 30864]
MRKTVKVAVVRYTKHPYVDGKVLKHEKNFLAHDEEQVCFVGDVVRIQDCHPISKRKHFMVVKVEKPVPKFVDPDTGFLFTTGM